MAIQIEEKAQPQPSKEKQDEMLNFFEWVTEEVKRIHGRENLFEKFVLTTSAIEQMMLPALMKFIARHHGVELPDDLFDRGNQGYQTNWLYYALSHDRPLFDLLETSRKKRNKLVHNFYKSPKIKTNHEKFIKEAIKINFRVMRQIVERFWYQDGMHKKIPSLTLYVKGWNDCREKILVKLDEISNRY